LDTTLQAEPRTVIGKQVRQLRRQGVIPANLYGNGLESRALQLPERLVTHRLARASRSALFQLELDGGRPQTVLVKSMQRHPVSGRVLHVDFYAVRMTEKLKATVPLQFVGEAPAVKQFDGTLMTSFDTVEVESLPADLPAAIEVDVSGLATFDDAVHLRDLSIPQGVEILSPAADEVIAKVLPPRVEVEEVAEAEEAAEAAETAAAEGEEPAEASAEGSAHTE
jgi:large subunit ribosomal protein L25